MSAAGAVTIESALRAAAAALRQAGIERGRVDAEVLLAHLLGLRRLDLIAHSERPLTEGEARAFDGLVERRASRYPLPYLTGEREFMGLTFAVNEHVLIPRPETETLVEAAVEALRETADNGPRTTDHGPRTTDPRPEIRDPRPQTTDRGLETRDERPLTEADGLGREAGPRDDGPASHIPHRASCIVHPASRIAHPASCIAIDVGTGSGCIAISLARFVPEARVLATDTSAGACAVARLNASRLGVADRVSVYEGDLLSPLESLTGAVVPPAERAAVICANLPYIPEENLGDLQPEVRDWEPEIALGGGPGGLHIIERFLGQVVNHLRPGGHLFLEIGPEADQSARLSAALAQSGRWCRIRVIGDLAGLPRVVAAVFDH